LNLSCGCRCEPAAYAYKRVIANVTCTDTCLLSVSTLCVPSMCTWAAQSFDSVGVKSAPKDGDTVYIGQRMTVECEAGYQLAPRKGAEARRRSLLSFTNHSVRSDSLRTAALGNVKVLAFMSFPPPPPGEAVSYGLTGAFSDITLDLPAGAWPADLLLGPSMAIFEMPPAARRAGALAGLGLNLGPDGTSLALPATITTPVDSDLDLGNRQLRVHRYNPANATAGASWTPMPYPEGYEVPSAPSVLKAGTSSFSGVYVALAVPSASLIVEPLHAALTHTTESTGAEAEPPVSAAGPASISLTFSVSIAFILSVFLWS